MEESIPRVGIKLYYMLRTIAIAVNIGLDKLISYVNLI